MSYTAIRVRRRTLFALENDLRIECRGAPAGTLTACVPGHKVTEGTLKLLAEEGIDVKKKLFYWPVMHKNKYPMVVFGDRLMSSLHEPIAAMNKAVYTIPKSIHDLVTMAVELGEAHAHWSSDRGVNAMKTSFRDAAAKGFEGMPVELVPAVYLMSNLPGLGFMMLDVVQERKGMHHAGFMFYATKRGRGIILKLFDMLMLRLAEHNNNSGFVIPRGDTSVVHQATDTVVVTELIYDVTSISKPIYEKILNECLFQIGSRYI